jgi:predicted membrane protein
MKRYTFEIFVCIIIGILLIIALPKWLWYVCLIIAAIPCIYYLIVCRGYRNFFKR